MAKCLVTGATGFIGLHLVRSLVERGDEVACLVRRTSGVHLLEQLPVRLLPGNVTDPESLAAAMVGIDVVYHLAGLTKSLTKRELEHVNQTGTEHVAACCASQARPPVLVLVSSLAAAGPALDGVPREPAEPSRPVSHYGESKLLGEIAASRFAHLIPLTIVRPAIVIGEGDLASLELFRAVARFRVHLVPGFGERRFSVIHVEDLVSELILAAERGRRIAPPSDNGDACNSQGCYYAASDEHPTFGQIGRLIATGLGRRRVLVVRVPDPLVWLFGGVRELCGQIIRRPSVMGIDKAREATAGSWICSPRTAAEDLGFRPAATLAERFRQTADWYRQEGWL